MLPEELGCRTRNNPQDVWEGALNFFFARIFHINLDRRKLEKNVF